MLRTFLDANVQRSEATGGVFTTHLDEHDLAKIYEGTLRGECIGGRLPETTCIGFACKAMRRNEFDVACYTRYVQRRVPVFPRADARSEKCRYGARAPGRRAGRTGQRRRL